MKKSGRDDFNKKTIDLVAKRVAYRCSFDGCGIATIGPKYGDKTNTSNIGVACHICAASKNGPRYDEKMTREERSSAENCIWMCQTHSVLIDREPEKYTAELLHKWKEKAEKAASNNLANYQFSKDQLKKKETLEKMFDDLIKDGNYDVLHQLISQSKYSDKDNEILLRYEIIYNVYCNREAVILSINYYLEHVKEKKCDEILKILVENNFALGIDLILQYCKDEELKMLASKIVDNTICTHLIGSKEDIEKEGNYTYKNGISVQKLLSNIVVQNKFVDLPFTVDGNKFELYNKEFAYNILAHSWNIRRGCIYEEFLVKEKSVDESYTIIKESIKKLLQLDIDIQIEVWQTILYYVINNKKEFDKLYKLCPILVKERKECKRIWILFCLSHNIKACKEFLKLDDILKDADSLILVLKRANKETRIEFLEDHKYLFRSNVYFIYLWSISCGLTNEEIYQVILKYKDTYKEDFLWNCLIAYYNLKDDVSEVLDWLENNRFYISQDAFELYIRVLNKYENWVLLKRIAEESFSMYNKYFTVCALMSNEDIQYTNFCIKTFENLHAEGFQTKDFYYNFSFLYNRIKDVQKAKYYLQKEYDYSKNEKALFDLLCLKYNYQDFAMDKYFEEALKSKDAETLLLVSIFYEKNFDYQSQIRYLLKALLADPENSNVTRAVGVWFLHNDKNKHGDLGKVYHIENDNQSYKIALFNNIIIDGIEAHNIDGYIPENGDLDQFIHWQYCSINDIVSYKEEEFKITSISTLSELLSKYTVTKLLKAENVTTITGKTPDEAVDKIKNLILTIEKDKEKIIKEYNDKKGMIPVSILARQLGCDYEEAWQFLICENNLKINNHSTELPDGYELILNRDAIVTLSLLDALKDMSNVKFMLPKQVKISLLSKLSDKIKNIQDEHTAGKLYSQSKQLYGFSYDANYRRNATLFYSKIRTFVNSVKELNASTYQSEQPNITNFYIKANLIEDSYVLGAAKSNKNYIIVTDDPFFCVNCSMENVPHISAIELLFKQKLTHDDYLAYLEKLSNYNFKNYFNATVYKKMIDSAIVKGQLNEFLVRFNKWLIPDKATNEHKLQVLDVYKDICMEKYEPKYFIPISEVGKMYFSQLYPNEYNQILERIKRSKIKVDIVHSEDGNMHIRLLGIIPNESDNADE